MRAQPQVDQVNSLLETILTRLVEVNESYKVNKYWSFLWKAAYFDGGNKPAFSKTTRSILQATVKF